MKTNSILKSNCPFMTYNHVEYDEHYIAGRQVLIIQQQFYYKADTFDLCRSVSKIISDFKAN